MSIELLQQLIRIPSYSGKEQQIQQFIQSHFKQAGIESFFQDQNVIVHLKGQDPTRAFIFNSHTDVVDAGDHARWTHQPFSADLEGGRIYGRGASDMKGGVYASIETAKSLSQRKVLPCDVWFSYVVREETDGYGTKSFAQWFEKQGYSKQYTEIAAIFTEPTNLTAIEHGNRGNFFIKAAIDGESAHSSRPHKIKTHAIMEMIYFINELEQEGKQWQDQFKGSEFSPPTITPTAIEARSASPNKTSDHCQAVFDLRTVPGFHREAFVRVSEIAKKRKIVLSMVYDEAPAGYTKKDAKIIQAIQAVIQQSELKVSEGSTDLGFLSELGVEGVIFGPGEKNQGHAIDESADIKDIEKTAGIYEQLFDKWVVL